MISVALDHTHISALIRSDGVELEVTAPGRAERIPIEIPGPCWTYVHTDSDVGIFHATERHAILLPHAANMNATARKLLERAEGAIFRSGMPVAVFRWEYRDLDGYRQLVPWDFYLPLPPDLAGARDAPRPSRSEARVAGLFGSNLRCNRCGGWGATWIKGERPGWGALALCGPHARELRRERDRHNHALDQLRAVNFDDHRDRDDDAPKPRRAQL